MSARQFNPEALVVARESRGETQASVGEAISVQQGFISKIENGIHSLAESQIEQLGRFLHYPPSLFYEPGPILQGKSGCLYHRKRKTVPAKLLNRLDGVMAVRLINARHLLHGLELDRQASFHQMDPDEYGSPEAVARRLRAAWRIPNGPIRNLVTLLESAGGMILFSRFGSHKLFGMSQWTGVDYPLFFLNADMAMEDLRWTLAHELGHLTMHATPTTEDLEAQADAFAGEFLAPRQQFASQVKNLTFAQLPALKMQWRISMKTIIRRAEAVGSITKQTSTRFYKQYSARRWNNAEPHPVSPEESTLIRAAANVHLKDHGYSYRELGDAVRLYEDELLRDLLGFEAAPTGLSVVR